MSGASVASLDTSEIRLNVKGGVEAYGSSRRVQLAVALAGTLLTALYLHETLICQQSENWMPQPLSHGEIGEWWDRPWRQRGARGGPTWSVVSPCFRLLRSRVPLTTVSDALTSGLSFF